MNFETRRAEATQQSRGRDLEATGETFDDRRAWIERLPVDEESGAGRQAGSFRTARAAPQAQDRLRKLEREIAEAPDHAKLEGTLADYGAWLERLTPGKQFELRQAASTEKRLRAGRGHGRAIGSSRRGGNCRWRTKRRLQDAMLELVEERRGELVQEVGRQGIPIRSGESAGRPRRRWRW